MRRLLLLTALLSTFACHASGQTSSQHCPGSVLGPAPYKLGSVLEAFCIPAPTAVDLYMPIQYGAFNSNTEFVLALQRVPSSDSLDPNSVQIMRYDKPAKAWTRAELAGFKTEVLPRFVTSCLGVAGGVEKFGELFYVSIELSPSAVCQLVVSDDLKLRTVLSGWPVAHFPSGAVVLQGSMVHFAPTHPLRLSYFDPQNAMPVTIYPPVSDQLRSAYINRLRTQLQQADRCQEENCESHPEQFEGDLGSIAVDEKTGSLAFVVKFSPIGFISFEKLKHSPEWFEEAVYLYRLFPGPVIHREFLSADVKSRYGTSSLDELLKPDMLARIFAD
jgi:hypothetical protein